MTEQSLDIELLKAHESEDYPALIRLYAKAGAEREALKDFDAACFYYTHAYVFALQEGAEEAIELSQKLAQYGRDVALN